MSTNTTQSNLIRLAPLQLGELPAHPSLPPADGTRPNLLSFLLTLLDDGADFLSPASFSANFKHHSVKSAPPSEAKVETLTYSAAAKELEEIVDWGASETRTANANPEHPGQASGHGETYTRPGRSKPPHKALSAGEYWVARRSTHKAISSKDPSSPGNANWKEFIFGLRDSHSKHEQDFTPTLYDAHCVCTWNEEIKELESQDKIVGKTGQKYSCVTMAIYEMCHATPPPTSPRCFPVLVATASISADEFLAVTVPVSLGTAVHDAIYSSGRNTRDGNSSQERKSVVLGVYTAIEVVRRKKGDPNVGKNWDEVEWIMATASDAKGNLPMWMQKVSVPGMIAKDVSYFLKWIKTVPDNEIESVKVV
ncbi:uncharacterized protein Z520_08246 [Fonsecaea multimorphosa CBS 102226]|uniref:DUF3074 domain-containing protein n=1 Tax=Fonsecaea multimorphosa CBS 102226 TaxID=1442371 RepID=A0A0D2IG06_9EURO|nr:uncharacterized protein Z520_08246 [Fonsecaea multimorphosa CBS 102226]KIX95991.1 hypothetical protein Z520_08246 [Fonsecaea multimorphosa CBS 102226]OAL21761.1 hypothetical protein AYO22_07703 [Fonsecaea multimorphosa]